MSEPILGNDIFIELILTSQEAEKGTVKPVQVAHTGKPVIMVMCKCCSGKGRLSGYSCTVCKGTGTTVEIFDEDEEITAIKKMDVRIPAGVRQGSKVRIAGEGGRGKDGGKPGDLFLLIQIQN